MPMRKLIRIALCLVLAPSAWAENWPQWRGPVFNGSSPETNLPSAWSKTDGVVWSAALPGPSAATPAVWGDRVFLSSTDLQNRSLVALCLDRLTGNIVWQHKISDGLRRDDRSTYSAPSPVTDGQRVFFFYSNGELAAFDFAGLKLWSRNLQTDYGAFAFLWTFSSTPVLFQDRLYLQVLQRDVPAGGRGRTDGPNDSYLLAMDPATGKTLWRVVRPSEAVAESREAFTTPVPFHASGTRRAAGRRGGLPDRPRSGHRPGTLALGHLESRSHRTLAAGAVARGGRWRDPGLRAQKLAGLRPSSRRNRGAA
jgi:hypothetical protein